MNNVAIIPARGGSKRIPGKNIKNFLGKPIIVYSIEAALSSGLFDEVMVSTDSEEIATIARDNGASVPFLRSKENSDDFAPTVNVLLEVLEWYASQGKTFDGGCCIYATAPFTSAQRLKEGHQKLVTGKFDSVFPVVKFGYPIWRALERKGSGQVSMFWEENLAKRSQDLPSAYHDAGQWYWFNTARIKELKKLWTGNTFGLEIDELEVQDIDNETDWKLAELKYKLLNGR